MPTLSHRHARANKPLALPVGQDQWPRVLSSLPIRKQDLFLHPVNLGLARHTVLADGILANVLPAECLGLKSTCTLEHVLPHYQDEKPHGERLSDAICQG